MSEHRLRRVDFARTLAFTDDPTDPAIRTAVLSSLPETFDPHLSQASYIQSLFVASQDEHFEVRVTSSTNQLSSLLFCIVSRICNSFIAPLTGLRFASWR
jgi:hypothetical protein